jgi:uncharacterized protein involved in exopolysaccharide biosynthesis
MNRTQIFSLLVGVIIFAFVGFWLEVHRYVIYGNQWPILGDVIVILFLIAVVATGTFVLFKELTSFHQVTIIAFFTVLGLIIGGAVWLALSKVAPRYTAEVAIEVLPPGQIDPFSFGPRHPDKDLYYQFRVTKAALIKQQNTLQSLLRRDKIRETNWFEQFKNDTPGAVEELEDNLEVKVRDNNHFIELSMTCKDKKESALIANEMLYLFLKGQQDRATRDVRNKLQTVTNQQRRLRTELQQAEDTLETIRQGTPFIDLGGADIPDYIAKALAESEAGYSMLQSELSVIENHIAALESQPEKTHKEFIREEIKHDPVMKILLEQLTLLELELAEKLIESGEEGPGDGQVRQMVNVIKQKMEERRAKMAHDIQQSVLSKAEGEMAELTEQFAIVQQQRNEARQQIKDFDNIRANYAQYISIRNEKQTLLEQVSAHIEKLYAVLESPDISRVKNIGLAPEPLKISSPLLRPYLLGGILLGLIAGLGFVLLGPSLNDATKQG